MILFEEDWYKYPHAIADYSTTNETFLRMVALYKDMGISNCLWPISLLQPELQGIDPHADNLSDEIKIKIGLECKYNFWYYLREVARIPPVAGPVAIPYKANRGNLALSWSFMCSIDFALIQPRQTGKSVSTDIVMDWLIYIGASNTLINMFTKDNDLRSKNVERLKKIRDLLPPYIISISKQDSDNQIGLTCLALANSYVTGVAQNSEAAANKMGRGLTSPIMHIDEAPFIKYIGTTMPAALASGTAAKEEAKLHGRPYGNIFTTTAGKRDDRDGKYMYELITGGAPWNEVFFDSYDRDELVKRVVKNGSGRKMLINGTFNHRQLGKTDEWLYAAMADSNASGDDADRDFFNVWTMGTQSSPLTVELNKTIKDSELDPLWSEITDESYIIRWYHTEAEIKEMVHTTQFILGLDTSDAIGRDACALVFINVEDLSVVGAATINETNLIRFSHFLSNILVRYTNTTLIPERKSSAQSIIDSLLITLPEKGIDPFKRIFNHVVDNHHTREREFAEITQSTSRRNNAFYDRYKKVFGFNTTGESRALLYSTVLQNSAKNSGHVLRDRPLSNEIRGLIVKNGRIDHSSGSNDDMVIAWLMTQWMLVHGKNLTYYGIDGSRALSKVSNVGKELTLEDLYDKKLQEDIQHEMEDIYEELTTCNEEYMIAKYESRLHALGKRVKLSADNTLSIDSMISTATELRKHSNRRKAMEQRQANVRNRRQSMGGWRR